MNMDAWIDCLTYIDEGDGMSRFHLAEGEALDIEVSDSEVFKSRLPEVYDALVECSSFVNVRRAEVGKPPVLSLIFSYHGVLKMKGAAEQVLAADTAIACSSSNLFQ